MFMTTPKSNDQVPFYAQQGAKHIHSAISHPDWVELYDLHSSECVAITNWLSHRLDRRGGGLPASGEQSELIHRMVVDSFILGGDAWAKREGRLQISRALDFDSNDTLFNFVSASQDLLSDIYVYIIAVIISRTAGDGTVPIALLAAVHHGSVAAAKYPAFVSRGPRRDIMAENYPLVQSFATRDFENYPDLRIWHTGSQQAAVLAAMEAMIDTPPSERPAART